MSYQFLDFLFENRSQLFKDENNYAACASIPIICKGKDRSIPLSSCAYQINQELLDLYCQPWINPEDLLVSDEFYEPLFDGNERKAFFDKLGIKKFVLIDYLREKISINNDIKTFTQQKHLEEEEFTSQRRVSKKRATLIAKKEGGTKKQKM